MPLPGSVLPSGLAAHGCWAALRGSHLQTGNRGDPLGTPPGAGAAGRGPSPVKPPYLGWRPQDSSGVPEGRDKPPQPHPPNIPRSFQGVQPVGVLKRVGKDMPPPGSKVDRLDLLPLTSAKSTSPRPRSSGEATENASAEYEMWAKNLVAATSSRSFLKKQNSTPNLISKPTRYTLCRQPSPALRERPQGAAAGSPELRGAGFHCHETLTPAGRESPAASCPPVLSRAAFTVGSSNTPKSTPTTDFSRLHTLPDTPLTRHPGAPSANDPTPLQDFIHCPYPDSGKPLPL